MNERSCLTYFQGSDPPALTLTLSTLTCHTATHGVDFTDLERNHTAQRKLIYSLAVAGESGDVSRH